MEIQRSQDSVASAIAEIATAIREQCKTSRDECEDVELANLELKIAHLGLFPRETWSLQHFPEELHAFCGFGIGLWQYPKQLVPLLLLLYRYDVLSYLEIGVAAGGTFTLVSELLKQWCGDRAFHALACDPAPPGCLSYSLDTYYQADFKLWLSTSPYARYVQEYSHKLEKTLRNEREEPLIFDCILIDGDHSAEGCWEDFEMAMRMQAGIIILHDVVNQECPGVCEVWQRVQAQFAAEFYFEEFAGQYESVRQLHGHDLLGIGVCVRKTMPLRHSVP